MELGGLRTIGSAFFSCEVGEVDWVSRPEIQSWRNRVIRDYKAPVPRQERSNAGYRMIRRPMSFRAPEHICSFLIRRPTTSDGAMRLAIESTSSRIPRCLSAEAAWRGHDWG
jgi:hypothetical protein